MGLEATSACPTGRGQSDNSGFEAFGGRLDVDSPPCSRCPADGIQGCWQEHELEELDAVAMEAEASGHGQRVGTGSGHGTGDKHSVCHQVAPDWPGTSGWLALPKPDKPVPACACMAGDSLEPARAGAEAWANRHRSEGHHSQHTPTFQCHCRGCPGPPGFHAAAGYLPRRSLPALVAHPVGQGWSKIATVDVIAAHRRPSLYGGAYLHAAFFTPPQQAMCSTTGEGSTIADYRPSGDGRLIQFNGSTSTSWLLNVACRGVAD